jgi:hypothetical protein
VIKPDSVPPLEELLPPNTPATHYPQSIDREINKLLGAVSFFLREAGVQTSFVQKREKARSPFQSEPKEREIETISYDVILQYFYSGTMKISAFETFKAVIHVTDQGIGAYEFRKKAAFWEIFNPAIWIAHLIRLPMWILHRAGFAPSQKFYESFIKTLVLVILGVCAVRVGLLTWKDLMPHFLKWLGI